MILAIDPGPTESAWLVYSPGAERPIGLFGKSPNEDLIAGVRSHRFDACSHLAVEMIASYGMAVGREVFETCVWIGRFIEAAPQPFTRVYRKDVKLHLCQSARANDSNIRAALIDRFGPPGTKKSPGVTFGISKDVWSALAVAVTFADTKASPAEEAA